MFSELKSVFIGSPEPDPGSGCRFLSALVSNEGEDVFVSLTDAYASVRFADTIFCDMDSDLRLRAQMLYDGLNEFGSAFVYSDTDGDSDAKDLQRRAREERERSKAERRARLHEEWTRVPEPVEEPEPVPEAVPEVPKASVFSLDLDSDDLVYPVPSLNLKHPIGSDVHVSEGIEVSPGVSETE